jgi:hypothetical protein
MWVLEKGGSVKKKEGRKEGFIPWLELLHWEIGAVRYTHEMY